tara:strand:- start:1017 stop:3509 length:2493 start_codon:yes stop_codon:yes gene_type:complete
MAVDKALNQAPLGLDATFASGIEAGVNVPEPDMEIEIEEDDEGLMPDGDDAVEEAEENSEFNENLAEDLEEAQLTQLAGDLIGEFEDDISSRKDWIQTYVDGLELLGMKVDDRSEPWPGACGVYHPLLAEAVVKFQAETMMETFPALGPVRTKVIGKETPAKRDAAARVQDDMNYQLTDVMVEYRPEHERMLWGLGLAGNAFKKVYYDPSLGRQVAMYVTADDVVVPYGASSLETAGRVTHVMRKTENEMAKLQRDGFYRDVDLGDPVDTLDEVEKAIAEKLGFRAETDNRYKLLEMHVDLVIEDDNYRDEEDADVALPYVVTLDKASMEVLAIRRNWDPDDKKKLKRNHFVHYSYVPGFGFYAFGLIHLIGAFAKSGTSIIRQLVDAGTLSNLPGGFKTKGLRVKGDDTPISPAEWRDVDVSSGTMRDNIMPLPYKEPSGVLFQLLGTIVEEGRKFAGAADMKISDMSGQAPVGTTLAILERTLKMMSAVQARVHYAMRQEFKLLKGIIRDYTPDTYPYEPEEGSRKAKKSDYDNVEVIPVSDPNAATMAQKIVQYQAVIQLAQMNPQIYDMPYLHRQMLEVLGIKNAQKLVPLVDDEDRKPRDPVSENMDIINGKPVKAFIYQDHEAHIIVHTTAMQDPKIMQLLGQNPQAQTMMAAMQAHIAEHLGFEYRKQVEQQAGVPLPPPDAEMDKDTELAVSRLAAAAAQQLLQKNQSEAQQQQNQQMAQDPLVQMQMQELQIKQQELQLKAQKFMAEAAEKNDKLDIERERIAAQKEIAGLQVGAKVATDKANLSAKEQMEGLRMGVQIAKEATAAQQPAAPPQGAASKEE